MHTALASLAVLITVPLAVLAAFIGLHFTGQSINTMTLGGLALAVGVMVDQAIVFMENILRHHRTGKAPSRAAWDGAREVATPILVSTVTFIAVFFPVVFLSGIAAYLFLPLALAVIFGMIGSYLFAVLIIPTFTAHLIRRAEPSGGPAAGEQDTRSRFSAAFASGVARCVDHPWITLLGTAALFAATVLPFSRLGHELFPRIDQGQFTVFVRAPSGTRIERTEALVSGVEKAIVELTTPGASEAAAFAQEPPSARTPGGLHFSGPTETAMIVSNIGVLMDWPAAYTWNSGPMDAFVLVELKNDRTRTSLQHVARLRRELPERFPGVEFAFDTAGMLTTALNFGLPSPINVRVEGTKGYAKAHDIAKSLRSEIARVPGAVDVRVQQKLDYPQIEINVDREKAAYYGLTQREVVKNIVAATNSSINFDPFFWIDPDNGNHYFMGVQYREEDIDSMETLEDLPIESPEQEQPVSLEDIATFRRTSAPAEITHLNITRMVDIFANVAPGYDVGSVARAVQEKVDAARAEHEEKGFRIFQSGEVSRFSESVGAFGFGFALAAALVYLILVVLFRSFREPFVILLTVPMGLIGVGWMLYITGTTLNVQSFMGVILMTGLVSEYGILLVDFADRRRAEGMSRRDAIVEAARIRLRPILMTSLTTALALVPMAFFGARGGGATAALARTVLGGVVAAALLTLWVMPALYRLLAPAERPPAMRLDTGEEPPGA